MFYLHRESLRLIIPILSRYLIFHARHPDNAVYYFQRRAISIENVDSETGCLNTKYGWNNHAVRSWLMVQNRSVATIMWIFTLVRYGTTGIIINAKCISRLESRKGAWGGNFHRKTRACATGFEAAAYGRLCTLQRPHMMVYGWNFHRHGREHGRRK